MSNSQIAPAPDGIPSYDIDLFSDAAIEDPMPHYARIRELGPVVWLSQQGIYCVGRFQETTEVLRSPLRFSSSRGLSLQARVNDILVGSTLNSDPPAHDLTRAVTSAPLLPGALKPHVGRIESAAEKLIESLAQRGEFDAVTDLASFLPVTIVAELVGLPDAGRERLLTWASATFNLFGPDNQRSQQAFADLQSLRDFLAEYGQPEHLKPGGWAKRIFEVGPERGITLETCAQLMRDYINPSLDTTISAIGQAVWLFAKHPDQWHRVRADTALIPNAIEEVVRLATPIRAFSRFIAQDTELSGVPLRKGERILAIYASANRDERKFAKPDRFDVERDVHDHVGFGHGVHMCMGMHLARLEIAALLRALTRRVERFELVGSPRVAMNNTIRAFASLPVRLVLADKPAPILSDSVSVSDEGWHSVIVANRRRHTRDIIELELANPDGSDLPAYRAGAHIDVEVATGQIRQYSLTGDPSASPGCYRIGVRREPDGVVSAQIHNTAMPGSSLRIGSPRQLFSIEPGSGRALLFGAGIGLTPVLAMAFERKALGQAFHLYVRVRSHDELPFRAELGKLAPHVSVSTSDTEPTAAFSYEHALGSPNPQDRIYLCGPNSFMDAVIDTALANGWQRAQCHTEAFGAEIDTSGDPFEVVCQRSGIQVRVEPGETIVAALERVDVRIAMSCRSGVCGTCLTRVLEGRPDHRDLVQTDTEKAANNKITLCCSRSLSKRLVLDL